MTSWEKETLLRGLRKLDAASPHHRALKPDDVIACIDDLGLVEKNTSPLDDEIKRFSESAYQINKDISEVLSERDAQRNLSDYKDEI